MMRGCGNKKYEAKMKSIVSIEWLKENIDDPNLVILYSNLGDKKRPQQYIPKSRLFDIKNTFSNVDGDFPNTFPSAVQFQDNCQKLGINNNSIIVVYDGRNTFSSPRVWWLFKTMGHQKVAVLNGGLQAWENKSHPTNKTIVVTHEKGDFLANLKSSPVKNFDFIKQNLTAQESLIIDARSADRFNGLVPESRKGLRSGHIPNSINIPYQEVLTDGKFKSVAKLKDIFKNIPQKKSLVFSCGSGVTACVVLLAAQQVIENKMAIYDGSWTEWGTLTS